MAFYRQSRNCPKFGAAQGHGASSGAAYGRDHYPLSYAVYGPQVQEASGYESATDWNPYQGVVGIRPYQGGWDALQGRLMHVPQADTYYTGPPNPWPANGVDDQPNARFDIIRLEPTTSAHPGYSLPSNAPSPAMVFHAPPIFGVQTTPIPAVGV